MRACTCMYVCKYSYIYMYAYMNAREHIKSVHVRTRQQACVFMQTNTDKMIQTHTTNE